MLNFRGVNPGINPPTLTGVSTGEFLNPHNGQSLGSPVLVFQQPGHAVTVNPLDSQKVLRQRRKNGVIPFFVLGVSINRGTPKWMVYNGKPH